MTSEKSVQIAAPMAENRFASNSRRYEKIRVERSGPVETITLCNRARRNAIGSMMVNELLYAVDDALAADDVRVIVLTGDGDAFCSGGDFSDIGGDAYSLSLPFRGDYADLLLALVRSEKPVIARVNGHAMGGGLGLVAASTFAIGTREALFGTPEIHVGLFPMMIMAVLARIVPRRRLLQMIVLGEKISAEEAHRLGIVGHVVVHEELDAHVERLAQDLAAKSPTAMRLGLRAFADQDGVKLREALPMLRGRLVDCLGTDDAREGMTAFLEKRVPVWSGK